MYCCYIYNLYVLTRFVFYMATVMPNSHGVFPRGAVIWNNTKVVDSAEDIANYRFSNKHSGGLKG